MRRLLLLFFTLASSRAQTDFSGRARNFSIELLHYTQLETDGHVVISPLGIWSLMTGVALGATDNSRAQLTRAFLLPTDQSLIVNGYKNLTKTVLDTKTEGVTLSTKNFVFLDNNFEIFPDFSNTLKTDFEADILKLDFKNSTFAANVANSAIEKSGATVANVMKSDDFHAAKMILTNVISFKGLWKSPFNASETKIEPFFDESKKEIGKVNMMNQFAMFPYSNIHNLNAHAIELPYGNDNKYSMLIILPYPGTSVNEVYRKFSEVTLKSIYEKMDNDNKEYGIDEVEVKIPRFKISTNVVLNKPLIKMGVLDIFDPTKASFNKVTNEDIYISAIVHKADIEVTETGTVASAVSSAILRDRISTPPFEANRPFIYFVMERQTATVIFSGIYSKPSVF